MSLKTNDRTQIEGEYPTILMIRRGLLEKLRKAVLHFQHDTLWKNSEIPWKGRRTHDVVDQKGVGMKTGKAGPLFAIGYR